MLLESVYVIFSWSRMLYINGFMVLSILGCTQSMINVCNGLTNTVLFCTILKL